MSRSSDKVCIHGRSLVTSTAITSWHIPKLIAPLDAVRVLNKAKISFMLIGSHSSGGWRDEPRASNDVDFLIANRHHHKAVKALLDGFPRLNVIEEARVSRLVDPAAHRLPLVELWRPFRDILRIAYRHRHIVRLENQQFAIPTLELALTLCYARFLDLPWSDWHKYLVNSDIIFLARSKAKMDLDKLSRLGEHVRAGAGQRLVNKVKAIQQGKKVRW